MATRKRTKRQTTIYKTSHKTKDRVTWTPLKTGVNSGAMKGQAVPAPLLAPVVLI